MKFRIFSSILIVVTAFFLFQCRKDSDQKGKEDLSPLPGPPAAAGQLTFTIDSSIDPASVEGYIVGKKDLLKVERAGGDQFFINNVPAGTHDVIITAGTIVANLLDASKKDKGVRLGKIEFLNGVRIDKNKIELPPLGSFSGKVELTDQTDHAGIDIYIPGTGYIAKSDVDGSYSIADVPSGTHNLFFEKDGYHRGQLESLVIKAGQATTVDTLTLALSTGAEGFLIIGNGEEISRSKTVTLTIGATETAVLMKISEDENFQDASWEPLRTSTSYNFATQGPKKLYVKLADANGLESSPYDASITIVMTAKAIAVLPSYFSEGTKVLTDQGSVHCWGCAFEGTGLEGELPDGKKFSFTPLDVVGLENGVKQIAIDDGAGGLALMTSGEVKCWSNWVAGKKYTSLQTVATFPTNVESIGGPSGMSSVCVLLQDGGVKCAGKNSNGQLGNGTTIDSDVPVDVTGLQNGVTAISSIRGEHACVILESGSLKCWGSGNEIWGSYYDADGNVTPDVLSPVEITGLGGKVTDVATGNTSNCVIVEGGAVKCWGYNDFGQLGDGTTTASATPRDVVGLSSGVQSISASGSHTCVVTTTGAAKCWGVNTHGQLGNGNTANASTPQDVYGLQSGVVSIFAGHGNTCAITSSGGVRCWGQNGRGALGDGTESSSSIPVTVIGFEQ